MIHLSAMYIRHLIDENIHTVIKYEFQHTLIKSYLNILYRNKNNLHCYTVLVYYIAKVLGEN